jgi:hypothetical protein
MSSCGSSAHTPVRVAAIIVLASRLAGDRTARAVLLLFMGGPFGLLYVFGLLPAMLRASCNKCSVILRALPMFFIVIPFVYSRTLAFTSVRERLERWQGYRFPFDTCAYCAPACSVRFLVCAAHA